MTQRGEGTNQRGSLISFFLHISAEQPHPSECCLPVNCQQVGRKLQSNHEESSLTQKLKRKTAALTQVLLKSTTEGSKFPENSFPFNSLKMAKVMVKQTIAQVHTFNRLLKIPYLLVFFILSIGAW